MKKLFIVLTVVFLAAVIARGMGENPNPKIKVVPEVWEIGQIAPSSRHSTTIEVYNIGGAPLIIDKVRSTCGCTTTRISTTEIFSGQKAALGVTFLAGSRAGKSTKKVYITSNDPETPKFTFTLTADVVSKEAK